MSKFPMIEKLGLSVRIKNLVVPWVDANELEALLQFAQVVYREKNLNLESSWIEESKLGAHISPNEKAFLLAITPIKKKNKEEKIIDAMSDIYKPASQVLCEIREILEMKD